MTDPSTLIQLMCYGTEECHLCEKNVFYRLSTLRPQIVAVAARKVDLVLISASCRPRSDSMYLWSLRDMATCVATDMT